MSKLIAIASSDWHQHKFKAFDVNGSRLKTSLHYGNRILEIAAAHSVPHLFTGDLVHTPAQIENETNTLISKLFDKSPCLTYAISGNHDFSQKNGNQQRSPSHLTPLASKPQFCLIDYKTITTPDFIVSGIPYFNSNQELFEYISAFPKIKSSKYKILLLHTDLPGAKTPEGIEVHEATSFPTHLDQFFKRWDLVLCGHIHKPQKLSNKVFMLGSPWHQTQGDCGTDMGYWKIYLNKKPEFVELHAPQFIKLKEGEVEKDDVNYYIPFETLKQEESVELGDFNLNQSRKSLAKKFCKVKNIKSKRKKSALIKILNEVE